MHAIEKRSQHCRKEKIEIAVSNLHAFVKREEHDEIRAIYVTGRYILPPPYQKFKVKSHIWHS